MPAIHFTGTHGFNHREAGERIEKHLSERAEESGTKIAVTTTPKGTRRIEFAGAKFRGTAEIADALTSTEVCLQLEYSGYTVPANLTLQDKKLVLEAKLPFIAWPFRGRIEREIATWMNEALA
jgi:hypothetical protein